jgi:fructose-1,6-bisphosphatase class II
MFEENHLTRSAADRRLAPSLENAPRVAPTAALDERAVLGLLRVVERAALAAAETVGAGDRQRSDQVAVEAMRAELGGLPLDARIVIGEGERDEAPMLYIGERLGTAEGAPGAAIDIAVDPLEGTNLCAEDEPNAITVLAASERGGLLHAPDLYMEKLMVGPGARGAIDLDAPVADNLAAIARSLGLRVSELVVVVLDRPRHQPLIGEIREAGASVRRISDGDLCAGISCAVAGSGVHAVMGSGGAPEGVLAAAALRCLGGEIQARLLVSNEEHERRCRAMGIDDLRRIYRARDLAPGREILFAATGVTDGHLLRGVRRLGNGARTCSLLLQNRAQRARFIDSLHVDESDDDAVLQLRL